MDVMIRFRQPRMLFIALLFLFVGQLIAGTVADSRSLLASSMPLQDQSRPAPETERLIDCEDETNGEDESQGGMVCLCYVAARLACCPGLPLAASAHPRDFECNLFRPPIL